MRKWLRGALGGGSWSLTLAGLHPSGSCFPPFMMDLAGVLHAFMSYLNGSIGKGSMLTPPPLSFSLSFSSFLSSFPCILPCPIPSQHGKIKPRALTMQGQYSTTELHSSPQNYNFLFKIFYSIYFDHVLLLPQLHPESPYPILCPPHLLSQTKQKVKTKHRILLILAIHSWTWRPDLDYDRYTYPVTLH